MSTQYGNVTWDALCEVWDDCSTGRIWNCLVEILENPGGGTEEFDWIQRYSLKNKDKDRVISLYVEVFKDHLDPQERALLETAGIRFTYVDKREVDETIKVIMKSKNIYTETPHGNTRSIKEMVTKDQMSSMKTVTLSELMKILKIK